MRRRLAYQPHPRDRSLSRWGSIAAAAWILVLMAAGWLDHAAWAQDPLFAAMAVIHDRSGSQAPDFSLRALDGQSVALSSLRGHVVLLNFWATWCAPCRQEMLEMERLYQESKDRGLVILAVDLDESPRLVARFMKEFRLTFPALLDSGSTVARKYRVQSLPTTVLVGRDSRTLGLALGARHWAGPDGRAVIRSLLERRER